MAAFSPCVLIPVYNHEKALKAVVQNVLAHQLPCILINDGSSAVCTQAMHALAAAYPDQVTLLTHSVNQGKGAAFITGVYFAEKAGYSHVFQIDADGQHDTSAIPAFTAAAKSHPDAVIAGVPVYDKSVPAVRFFCRYLTHMWVWINTLSLEIQDSMCGFRVYPVSAVISLLKTCTLSPRMAFDTDILVRLFWAGVRVINMPAKVTYPADGISHFRSFADNAAISFMHTRHFFGMLMRLPRLLAFRRRAPL